MKRGDLVTVALSGEHGKPRPALVIQADEIAHTDTLIIVPITSSASVPVPVRVCIEANDVSGLRETSYAMLNRITSAHRRKIGPRIGQVDAPTLLAIERALLVVLGIRQ